MSALRLSTLAAALLAACGGDEGGGPRADEAWLEPVESSSGLDFQHVRAKTARYWFPEIMGGGAALFDFDGDGYLDAYLVQSGDLAEPMELCNRLYRNRGDGTFEDVTQAAGVGDRGYGMGVACGDYDGDGDTDLYVTNVGANVLYRNEGDGTFVDVTVSAGVGHEGWGTSAAFADYDADGDLDLFVVNYLVWSADSEIICDLGHRGRDYCSPKAYERPAMDTLYRNRGDGTFEDVTRSAGLAAAFGNGLGVAWGDFDGDRRVDFYVANDGTPNQLWLGTADGRFEERALIRGCAVNHQGSAEAGMGVAALDADDDGDLDLFMTHLRGESNTLYRNEGGTFEDVTAAIGLSGPSISFTGFGMGFSDLDCDGRLDLFIANGRVMRVEPHPDPERPYAEPNLLFRGEESGFQEVGLRGGVARALVETSRAAAFGDFDNDGGVDVLVAGCGSPARLLRNVRKGRGEWIAFRVVDRTGSDALGARVTIVAGGHRQTRRVQVAYGYCASNDPRVHFGLGETREIDELEVTWPDGRTEGFAPPPVGEIHVLRAGEGL